MKTSQTTYTTIEHDNGVNYNVKIAKIDYKVIATTNIKDGATVNSDNTMGISSLADNGKVLIRIGTTTPLKLFTVKYDIPTTLYISGERAKSIYAIANDVVEIEQAKKPHLSRGKSLFDLAK